MNGRLIDTDTRDGPCVTPYPGPILCRWSRWATAAIAVVALGLFALSQPSLSSSATAAVESADTVPAVVAEGRFALVIGISNYATGQTAASVANARAMAKRLESLGFAVELAENPTIAELRRALDGLSERTNAGDVAFFYFAGHSLYTDKETLLLPADAVIESHGGGVRRAISIENLLQVLHRSRERVAKVVVLDTAPYPEKGQYRGLRVDTPPLKAPANFVIAQSDKLTAERGPDGLSVFTKELIGAIGLPGQSVERAFRAVTVAASGGTSDAGRPTHTSTLSHDIFLVDPQRAPGAAAAAETEEGSRVVNRGIRLGGQEAPQARLDSRPPRGSETAQASGQSPNFESALWNVISGSENPADFEAYLEVFPSGQFATEAKQRLSVLRAPPPPKSAPSAPRVEAMRAEYELVVAANIRELPDTSASILDTGDKGERLLVTGRVVGANWYQVKTRRGATAYVASNLLREPPKAVPEPAKPKVAVAPPRPAPSRPAAPSGDGFRDCPTCPEMVRLPAGAYRMGSDSGDSSEGPPHTVRLAKPFAVGKYEVTIAEWNTCVDAGGCSYRPRIKDAPDNAPVHKLSWKDVQEYIAWINKVTGKPYRLLSEAEWEYAARGGVGAKFWWGDRMVVGVADCKDCGNAWSYKFPSPVGTFKANPFGLHGMNGGVWEWTDDCWRPNHDHAPTDGSASTTGDCSGRVLRGGSWRNDADYARVTSRLRYDYNVRYSTNGFRVARDLP